MADSATNLIKEKLDIVEFIRGYITLQPAGKNFKALCPFHREKTPSFIVSPDRQSWHCFGCGIGGDSFAFLMRHENLEFGEALRVLAERTGVELKRLNPAEYKFTGLLYELQSRARDFFRNALRESVEAQKYFRERGLSDATTEEFELGWAPNNPEALSLALINSGYAPEDIMRSGLAFKNDRGMLIDRFRGRLIFPIHNHLGKVAGFSGRIFPKFEGEGVAKYLNSPESPTFNKSKLLYGFWKSRNAIKEKGAAFLVEGQMDFLMSYQAGVTHAVASSGTALTGDHLKTLRRLCEEVFISFDSDAAGSAAAERAIDLAEESDFSTKVVVFKDFKDPAEAAQRGAEHLLAAIKEAKPAPEFYFAKYLSGKSVSDWSKREDIKNLRVVLAKLKGITSAVNRSFWMKELARRTNIEEKTLVEEMAALEVSPTPSPRGEGEEEQKTLRPLTRRELIGEKLIGVAVSRGDYTFLEGVLEYLPNRHAHAVGVLKQGARRSDIAEVDEVLHFILLGARALDEEELEELKKELTKEYIKEQKQYLMQQVRRAEEKGDEAELASALSELQRLSASTSQ